MPLKIKTTWKEKEPTREVPKTPPELWGFCWSCRKCLDVGYLYCKLNKKEVKKDDTCEKFFGYEKKRASEGKKPHGKQRR